MTAPLDIHQNNHYLSNKRVDQDAIQPDHVAGTKHESRILLNALEECIDFLASFPLCLLLSSCRLHLIGDLSEQPTEFHSAENAQFRTEESRIFLRSLEKCMDFLFLMRLPPFLSCPSWCSMSRYIERQALRLNVGWKRQPAFPLFSPFQTLC
mmetsp:Transcript_16797/g.24919  ORF Transcript_16797/g.24919 Transcript_16797/m.24919 type:complete len:153 (+) Transcript_16797:479-937(+)